MFGPVSRHFKSCEAVKCDENTSPQIRKIMKGISETNEWASLDNIESGFRSYYISPRGIPSDEEIESTFRHEIKENLDQGAVEHQMNCHSTYRLLTSIECITHFAEVHHVSEAELAGLLFNLYDLPLRNV